MREGIQVPIREAPRQVWDAIVIGAGPAGSIASLRLAENGHKVLLLDRKRFPREKVCGDGLIHDSLKFLASAGLLDRVESLGHELNTWEIYSPSRYSFRFESRFISIRRSDFDMELAKAATDAGAVFSKAGVAEIKRKPDGLLSLSSPESGEELSARVCIIATGADIGLLKKLGMVRRAMPSGIAARCYLRSDLKLDRPVVSFDKSLVPGYAWIFPMGDGEYNIGCGLFFRKNKRKKFNLRTMFDAFCREFPIAKELISKGKIVSRLRPAMLRCGLSGTITKGEGNIIVVGEAAGATFPLTGEGIGKAMESAEIAGGVVDEALRRNDESILDRYPAILEERLRGKYGGFRIAENWISVSWLSDWLIRRAGKNRYIHESLSGIITESADPGAIFSIGGILKSFYKR